MRDRESITADQINGHEFADPRATWEFVCRLIERKEPKRKGADWRCADATFLVIAVDCPLDQLAYYLNRFSC